MDSFQYARSKLRALGGRLPHLRRSFAFIFSAGRRWTVIWVFLLIIQGILPLITVNLTRALVNNIAAVLKGTAGQEQIRYTVLLVIFMAAIQLLSEVLRAFAGWVRTMQSELIQDHITSLIHAKSIAVDLTVYDTPDFYDRLHRARMDASFRPVALLENLGGLLQNGITLIAMAAVLIPFGFWLPVALFLSTIPAVFVVLRYFIRQHDWFIRNTPNERKSWYFSYLMIDRDPAAEVRLFNLGDLFNSAYVQLRALIRKERLELMKQQSVAELIAGTAGYVISSIALVVMVLRTVRKSVSLGDLALFYQAFSQGQRLMRTLLDSLSELYKNSLFLENLFEFLELQPKITTPAHPVDPPKKIAGGIQFYDVTYRYPGSERIAIRNFNLHFLPNQLTAIVGQNGAGKSTLIKLICRLYDPDEGRIELDGINLKEMDLQKLRRMITVLFQEPVHYNDSVSHNIGFGDLNVNDEKLIAEAAQAAGANEFIETLPQKYQTLLGTSFAGGSELSVGEWQRISLARAFLREAPILLLDEPTSAMDSWAEIEWMSRLRYLLKGRTAIVITHRFTTAMQADVIHVMSKGQIIESGSHEELLLLDGEYARSWRSQMGNTLSS
jgi:ATP-binding cassette subfamily B protein